MKKLIIIGFFYLFSAFVYAEVQVQVDPSQISIDDSFRLILTQDNLQNGGIPDLTPLQKDFMILGTERRMNYSIINGQTQSSSEWTVTLKPQKEGKLTIPAIKIGREYSKPLTIDVTTGTTSPNTPSDTSTSSQKNQALYLTTQVDKKNPYVNQQIIYKVTLYNSKHLLDADYQAPQVENALLVPLGENKRSQIQKNGVPYLVEEQNYAIFPQKSGPLKIKSPVFTALIYDFNPERVQAKDKTMSIDVQPIPKGYSSKIWLPAKGVKLFEQYENSDQTITQGNTLIRNVIIEGVGVPAQLLPTLNFADADGVSVYPEKGKDKNRITQGELIGRTEIKVTYLFNKAGKTTIPELKLPWFNTETGKEEIATLPAKTLEVTPSNTVPAASTSQPAVSKNQNTVKPIQTKSESPSTQFNWAWAVAALFALAWLITLILWAWQRGNKNTGKGRYKTVLNELHKSCTQGNPQRARDALLKWASLHWPDAPILNLTDLTRLTADASFKKQVQLLSQILYKNKEKTLWRGDELWRSIQQIKKNNAGKKENNNDLPPINPI
ncbi:KQDN repeat-containing protein [Legionella steigerwaltii]|uniref:KQDN repeat-containing protein n=1 Tax=Legionella steigerwaltii TaxID=460 RepID=A0A378L3A6_9GAMM|nr:BatD family protein [Legionella steigerwaltii]KTD77064.1 KQDN repeat-containing protein [Legionella steigerwaltii]STY21555.1 KQDN repeat-containing protein [Legionella steigerwaltii]